MLRSSLGPSNSGSRGYDLFLSTQGPRPLRVILRCLARFCVVFRSISSYVPPWFGSLRPRSRIHPPSLSQQSLLRSESQKLGVAWGLFPKHLQVKRFVQQPRLDWLLPFVVPRPSVIFLPEYELEGFIRAGYRSLGLAITGTVSFPRRPVVLPVSYWRKPCKSHQQTLQ